MADDGSKDTKQSDRSEKASTHYTIEWVRGMPSLIVGIQRRKASIRTPFAARFHHSPSSTEGRHVPAPVGGCRRPHDHRRTAVVPEPPCTTSTTSTILHRHYAGAATQPPASSGTPTPEWGHGDNGSAESWWHHVGFDAARRIPLAQHRPGEHAGPRLERDRHPEPIAHVLRGGRGRRNLEDDQRRYDVPAGLRQ